MSHPATCAPTDTAQPLGLEHLGTWLQHEQREALHHLARCRAAGNAEDAVFWARRHAQLAIATNALGWFNGSTEL